MLISLNELAVLIRLGRWLTSLVLKAARLALGRLQTAIAHTFCKRSAWAGFLTKLSKLKMTYWANSSSANTRQPSVHSNEAIDRLAGVGENFACVCCYLKRAALLWSSSLRETPILASSSDKSVWSFGVFSLLFCSLSSFSSHDSSALLSILAWISLAAAELRATCAADGCSFKAALAKAGFAIGLIEECVLLFNEVGVFFAC